MDLTMDLFKPESASQARSEVAANFLDNAKTACDRGAWKIDSSRHTVDMPVDSEELKGGTTLLTAQPGRRTWRLASSPRPSSAKRPSQGS